MTDQEQIVEKPHREEERTFPVVEVFGPTIQGEGPEQGRSCYFVRFGGCDFKCTWCDTPFAVLPHLVRQAKRLNRFEIIGQLHNLPNGPRTVVLSGGNPLLLELGDLCDSIRELGYRVTVETQGTLFKRWLFGADQIVVSPKPPSSGMEQDIVAFRLFMERLRIGSSCLKIVVFDHADYAWASLMHQNFPQFKMFLSAGNDAGATVGEPDRIDKRSDVQIAEDLITKGRWLANRVMVDQDMSDVQVQMQQHVLYWGNERGR